MNEIIKIGVFSLTTFVLVLVGSLESYAITPQSTPDSVVYSLYFRQGDDLLMKDYRSNEQTINDMAKILTGGDTTRILKINIIGSASPEDGLEFNDDLSLRRAESVRGYIIWQWGFTNRQAIQATRQTDYLSAWVRAVDGDTNVPRRDKVLEILNTDASVQTKWANVKLLTGGVATYMEQYIFPALRNTVACVVTFEGDKPTAEGVARHEGVKSEDVAEKVVSGGAVAAATAVTQEEIAENAALPADKQAVDIEPKTKNTKQSKEKCKKDYHFGIKTNLLQGAVAFAPNLGVEYAINDKSTIELTGVWNNWGLDGSATSNKKLAHWVIQSEYRYWLGKSFCGHFFGAHLLGGKYNISGHTLPNLFWGGSIMESKYRYDGWTLGAGISYGYHLRFAKHWGVEFNIGIGVAHLSYDKYDCIRCGKKLSTENKTYFDLTKAGISLIYNF